ncbi:MAG TPA: PAS domain S-box protein [Hyphomicrobiaceae bacterium]|nr:PAS domain S-box protein [Hyphomicrobiaceae bacterium]
MSHTSHDAWQDTLPGALAATIVKEAPDAILYCDSEGIIRFWNGGCERIFGYTADEASSQSLDIIIPVNLRERHWQGYRETMRTGHTRYAAGDLLAVPAVRKDGVRISIEFSIIPFRDANRIIIGMAAIMRDVTKRFEEIKALRKRHAAGP